MRLPQFRTKRRNAQAVKFTGTLESEDLLITWASKQRVSQSIQVSHTSNSALILMSSEGTWDIREGYWVVLESGSDFLKVYDDEEFRKLYEEAPEVQL